jgi:protein SCO1/2
MFKNKSYIGISFIILVLEFMQFPKLYPEYKTMKLYKGTFRSSDWGNKEGEKLIKIGPAPKFRVA